MEARIKMLENSVRILQQVNEGQDMEAFKDLLAVVKAIGKLERRIARLEGMAGDGEKAEDSGGTPPGLEPYLESILRNLQR